MHLENRIPVLFPMRAGKIGFQRIKAEMGNGAEFIRKVDFIMIVMKDNERLYLTSWNYNASRIVSRLAELVVEKGGRVKPIHPALITNRTLSGNIHERENHLQQCIDAQARNYTELREKHINAIKEELDRLYLINNDPIRVTHTTYISFVLDDMYYYYQMDDNPFFEFYGSKTPIISGMYNPHGPLRADPKKWEVDDVFRYNFSYAAVNKAANSILAWLVGMTSNKASDKYMRRVDF